MKAELQKTQLRTLHLLLVFATCVVIWISYNKLQEPPDTNDFELYISDNTEIYISDNAETLLINTSQCKIPKTDPFSHEIKKYLQTENYTSCSKLPLLSYVKNEGCKQFLHINQTIVSKYNSFGLSCCYVNIDRQIDDISFDDTLAFSQCIDFEDIVLITSKTVLVRCTNFRRIKVYENVHSVMNPNNIKKNLSDARNPSVIFFGIDSMSQSNLIRTMPKTVKFLEETGFIKLKGYTKVADNTYPNLIPIITGRSCGQIYKSCDPKRKAMDECDLIWKDFNNANYITAYAEDQTSTAMFNFGRKGFREPPTDFYFRPYFLASERRLKSKKINGWVFYCTGPENVGERVINLAKDFTLTFEHRAKFGWFWTASFSHENYNTASSMDDKFLDFFNDIKKGLSNTIFVFLSDHGFRFGKMVETYTGWIEERLPFVYIYIPESFRMQYPEKYSNLLINSERLTSPFDLYMTLQDILSLTEHNYSIQQSEGCPKCRSLFEEVAENRNCSDAAITKNWCLCSPCLYLHPSAKVIKEIAEFIVSQINSILAKDEDGRKCFKFYLHKISSSCVSHSYRNQNNQLVNYYVVSITTLPPARFSATVEVFRRSFRILGDISRTNKYAEDTKCIKSWLEKYCYCKSIVTFLKMFLGLYFK